jgi:hypothetical protein
MYLEDAGVAAVLEEEDGLLCLALESQSRSAR